MEAEKGQRRERWNKGVAERERERYEMEVLWRRRKGQRREGWNGGVVEERGERDEKERCWCNGESYVEKGVGKSKKETRTICSQTKRSPDPRTPDTSAQHICLSRRGFRRGRKRSKFRITFGRPRHPSEIHSSAAAL